MRTPWQVIFFAILLVSNSFLLIKYFTASRELVYIDSAKLMNGYQGMIDARKDYQQKTTVWKANIDTLIVEIQREIANYEKDVSKMSVKEKELTGKLIQSKQQQLAEYQKAINDKAAQEDNQLTTKVVQEVNAYLKEYGKGKGYRIILAATDYGNIVYAQEGLDITDEVLEGLNRKYRGE
ncbi:MAG: OmpH family outer membrane protein [Cyclobacteriaceae bacterium]|nr:OmpH family outer membrane protein [Cyclobacteriaceae bacterium]